MLDMNSLEGDMEEEGGMDCMVQLEKVDYGEGEMVIEDTV